MISPVRLLLLTACLWTAGLFPVLAQTPDIKTDVVYGHKDGMAMTFDVFRPEKPNGAGILFLQSGGWYSIWNEPQKLLPACQPLLDRGFTVFCVYHGSAPRYVVPEAVADVRRAARFIRLHAAEYGVQSDRLGALGGSAGGHLTLMLATTGDDGDPKAGDEVLRQSSRIAAAVAMYPPTDLRNWTTHPPEAIAKIPALKPPLSFPAAQEAEVSPLLQVTADTPPICLIHGDKDELVSVEHSRNLYAKLQETGRPSRLLIIEGAGHSFNGSHFAIAAPAVIEWFEKYLSGKVSQ